MFDIFLCLLTRKIDDGNAVISDITNAELTLVAKEIQKSCNQKVKYQKAVPETTKKEVGVYTKVHGTSSATKKVFVEICQA